MTPEPDLSDLVSQLEASKFTRLIRFMANLPVVSDRLKLPAAAYGIGETELLVRKLGAPSSLAAWAVAWIYHQAYLPVGLWTDDAIVAYLKERLTAAKRDLNAHSNSSSILYASAQQKGDGCYIPDATSAFYYLTTNIAAPLSAEAMNTVSCHFRNEFGQGFEEFGFATPQSMAKAAPREIQRFTLDLLNSPSSYYFVAREGQVSVAPVTEHGLYFTGAGGRRSTATATSTLPFGVAGLADLDALVASRATSEADL